MNKEQMDAQIEEIDNDIECAKDWLHPGNRKPTPLEIDNCIGELQMVVTELRILKGQEDRDIKKAIRSRCQCRGEYVCDRCKDKAMKKYGGGKY